jgi:hypothetical protein
MEALIDAPEWSFNFCTQLRHRQNNRYAGVAPGIF